MQKTLYQSIAYTRTAKSGAAFSYTTATSLLAAGDASGLSTLSGFSVPGSPPVPCVCLQRLRQIFAQKLAERLVIGVFDGLLLLA